MCGKSKKKRRKERAAPDVPKFRMSNGKQTIDSQMDALNDPQALVPEKPPSKPPPETAVGKILKQIQETEEITRLELSTLCHQGMDLFLAAKTNVNVDDAYGLGRHLLELEDAVNATEAFEWAVKKLPKSKEARLSLGIAQLQQGTFAGAKKAAQTLNVAIGLRFTSNDRVNIAKYMYGEALRRSYKYDKSLKEFESIMSTKSNVTSDKDVLKDVVRSYFSACRAVDCTAKLDLVRVLCSRITTYSCYESLGGWYMRMKNVKKAKTYFRKGLKLGDPRVLSLYDSALAFPYGSVGGARVGEVLEFEDFLSLEESDKLADIIDHSIASADKLKRKLCYADGAAPKRIRNLLVSDDTKIGYDCISRDIDIDGDSWDVPSSSASVFVDAGDIDIVKRIEHRIFERFGLSAADGWPTQLLKYPPGVSYASHTDCTLEKLDPFDRAFTVLIYLNHIRSGGTTTFSELEKRVHPVRGKAVLFSSLDRKGYCSPKMFHSGDPVTGSKAKYVFQKWYRRPAMGKRKRSENGYFGFHRDIKSKNRPRILCDMSQSCREYIPLDTSLPATTWNEEL